MLAVESEVGGKVSWPRRGHPEPAIEPWTPRERVAGSATLVKHTRLSER